MLKLAANISLMYPGMPLPERCAAAAQAGFSAVEVMYLHGVDVQALAAALQRHGLELTVLNLPPGDHAAGERGLACLPGRESDFEQSLKLGLEHARALGCRRVHLLTGNLDEGCSLAAAWPLLLANVRRAAAFFARHGITVLLEPLSREMLPRYSLTRIEDAVGLIRAAGAPNLRVQLDLYHTQMEQGHLATRIERHYEDIDYIQIAGVPGRHEPDIGEINYGYLFDLLEARGYGGWIGCEYDPAGDTVAGLEWARRRGLLPQRKPTP